MEAKGKEFFKDSGWQSDTDLYLTSSQGLPHLNIPTDYWGGDLHPTILKEETEDQRGKAISQGPASHWQTKPGPRS